ncbi:MAG TPA: GNAT family N-acetyltransferase [Pyrinomonadaceae bacterium]
MNGPIEIRKLDESEIALARSLILMFGGDGGAESEKITPPADEHIAAMLARGDFHVIAALDGNRLVGGLTAYEMTMFKRETREMFLYEIEVSEPFRRRGIGKALIESLKAICEEKSIAEMFVGTSRDNLAARKLYAATGGKADTNSVWFNYLFSEKQ